MAWTTLATSSIQYRIDPDTTAMPMATDETSIIAMR